MAIVYTKNCHLENIHNLKNLGQHPKYKVASHYLNKKYEEQK